MNPIDSDQLTLGLLGYLLVESISYENGGVYKPLSKNNEAAHEERLLKLALRHLGRNFASGHKRFIVAAAIDRGHLRSHGAQIGR